MAGNSLSFITDGLWTSAFVMRKKGCYHKNRPFRLLVAAALRFVQFYLNDIELLGVTSDLSDAPAIDSDYLWLFCILSNIVHTHQASSSVPNKVIKAERQFHSGSPLRHYFTAAFYSSIAFSFNKNSYKPRCRIPSSSVHGFMDDLLMIIFLKKSFVFFRGLSSVSILDGSFTFRAD